MISLKHKFLFIHPPKTAGTSIEQALIEHCEFIDSKFRTVGRNPLPIRSQMYRGRNTKHWTPRYYSNNFDTRGFFKFASIRNPWDRFVSYFFMLTKEPWVRENFHEFIVQCKNDFTNTRFSFYRGEELPSHVPEEDEHWMPLAMTGRCVDYDRWDFRSCHKMLLINQTREGEEMDHFIRFHNLQGDFDEACDRIGISRKKLPHHGNGRAPVENGMGYTKHYTEYYDDELIEIVAKNYKDDIDYFGFKFGE